MVVTMRGDQLGLEAYAYFHALGLVWCLLVVARVAPAQGVRNVGSFMFYWTDNCDLNCITSPRASPGS
jgi:hypothetical protein